ncbi:hypothetical protein [Flavobacterium sp. NKUCC04_CG]|uniref:hypothetical protein n=1 Tax=Flavobacterium sp. NKUCC04_CG TaxID=2842121 RepID=UPI001C5B9A2D|nr:hypothetical protein [Flavobacterium sp. NKUCC04_CG]MBW3519805.1 hypothetical protein [Flavobacterium sp. NKUCC04_CG]
MEGIDSKVKFFLYFMMFFPLVGLFGYVFWESITDDRTSSEIYLSYRVKIVCFGKVKSIHRGDRQVLVLNTSDGLFEVPFEWEDKFKLDDSISKKKGELTLEHYRSGTLIEMLDYNEIAKNIKY